eukprot:751146-Hanusia_phi.AAC.2
MADRESRRKFSNPMSCSPPRLVKLRLIAGYNILGTLLRPSKGTGGTTSEAKKALHGVFQPQTPSRRLEVDRKV